MKTISFFLQWHLLERWAEPAQINSQKCIPIHKYKLKDTRNSKTQAVFFGHAREIIRLISLHRGFGRCTNTTFLGALELLLNTIHTVKKKHLSRALLRVLVGMLSDGRTDCNVKRR